MKFLTILLTMTLMSFVTGCATTPDLALTVDVQRVTQGQAVPEDGAFLSPEAAHRVSEIVEERDALREQYMDYPDQWQRIWTNAAIFVVGVGVGVWLIP